MGDGLVDLVARAVRMNSRIRMHELMRGSSLRCSARIINNGTLARSPCLQDNICVDMSATVRSLTRIRWIRFSRLAMCLCGESEQCGRNASLALTDAPRVQRTKLQQHSGNAFCS